MKQQFFNKNPKAKFINDSLDKVLQSKQLQQVQKQKSGGSSPTLQQIYTIPVVVHIIHNNGPENISDAQVITAIQHLNDAFRNVGVYDPSTGVDVEIVFCLAQQDENGNYSTGINRVLSSYTNLTMETDDITLKNLIRWDPTKYLNIWIVKEISSLSMGTGVAGYAYYPSSYGNPEDGIVNEANYFGTNADDSKVAVHEVGHYLGLYHTFEGACTNNNCLTDGDQVCDTPPDGSTSPVFCGGSINTCQTDDDDISANNPFRPVVNGGIGDQNDMFINYMDYGFQVCQSAFTEGQKNRMISVLTGIRNTLLQSNGCATTCVNPIVASFNSSSNNVIAGTTVSFTNTSTGAITYSWEMNGVLFSSSNNISYTFNTEGTYLFKLIAENGDIACTDEYTVTITVTCPVMANFTANSTSALPGDNITFTNTSSGATTYQWFIDGVSQGSSTDLNYTFSNVGNYSVLLVADNGICSDTLFQYFAVGLCTGKETNTWYFGAYAGLDFNSGSPFPLFNSAMDQWEGCSSISDVNGDLVLYTNGYDVWNKNHVIMPNGDSLYGDVPFGAGSSTQSSIVIPQPGNSNIYYIFTAAPGESYDPAFGAEFFGVAYSVVDMSQQSGLGDVTIKNVPLVTTTSEKLTAVKHCNGTDIWVITHDWGSNGFYAYLVTASGVNTTPVVSFVGTVIDSTTIYGTGTTHGQLKASPDGSKLAQAIQVMEVIEFFDFDNSTGVVSNPITFQSLGSPTYGIEFSPDGSKVYCSSYPYLYQFDLQGTAADVINSATILPSSDYLLSLQLAPDGKIYISEGFGSSFLSVINNPNIMGTGCNYTDDAIDLSPNTCEFGLPNFMSSFFYKGKPIIIGPDTICSGEGVFSLKECYNSADWSLSGSGSIVELTPTSVSCHFDSTGIYTLTVEALGSCGMKRDTLTIVSLHQTIELGNDTTLCPGNTLILDAGAGFSSYLWQNGSTSQTLTANSAGQYKVIVTTATGCSITDSIVVDIGLPATSLDLGPDISICNGGVVVLDAGDGFASYQWEDGSSSSKHTVYLPGKYWVTVSSCGSVVSDTVNVIWQNSLSFSILQEGNLCLGQAIDLKATPSSFLSYIWDDGSFNYTRQVLETGTYSIIVTDENGCYGQDTLDVIFEDCDSLVCGIIYIPNAFSPNNDMTNDIYRPTLDCVKEYSFLIFNRWGEKLFETTNIADGWRGDYMGKMCQQDVYVYKISFVDDIKKQFHQKTGSFTLLSDN